MLLRVIRNFTKQKRPETWLESFKLFTSIELEQSVMNPPSQKERSFTNIKIASDFKRQEKARKLRRISHLKERQRLLQERKKISSQFLLSPGVEELQKVNSEIEQYKKMEQLQINEQKIITNTEELEENEAEFILLEGMEKIVLLNAIEDTRYMLRHQLASGLTLTGLELENIQNVHYLVNNNLPVHRYKIFDIMPEFFVGNHGEFQSILDKFIISNFISENEKSRHIRFYTNSILSSDETEIELLKIKNNIDRVGWNMIAECRDMLDPYGEFIKKVVRGETPYRDISHMIYCLLTDSISFKMTPEEEGMRKVMEKMVLMEEQLAEYTAAENKRYTSIIKSYQAPPPYIANHPFLLKQYNKFMDKYTNPRPITESGLIEEVNDDQGYAYLYAKMDKLAKEKYDPAFKQLMDSGDRSKIHQVSVRMKAQMGRDFAILVEEYNDLIEEGKAKEQFHKITQQPKPIAEKAQVRIPLSEMIKAIFLNNRNPEKYTIELFNDYFGVNNIEDMVALFNSFSYLYVPQQKEVDEMSELKFEYLKFKDKE